MSLNVWIKMSFILQKHQSTCSCPVYFSAEGCLFVSCVLLYLYVGYICMWSRLLRFDHSECISLTVKTHNQQQVWTETQICLFYNEQLFSQLTQGERWFISLFVFCGQHNTSNHNSAAKTTFKLESKHLTTFHFWEMHFVVSSWQGDTH